MGDSLHASRYDIKYSVSFDTFGKTWRCTSSSRRTVDSSARWSGRKSEASWEEVEMHSLIDLFAAIVGGFVGVLVGTFVGREVG
jgi:hypothetical protein